MRFILVLFSLYFSVNQLIAATYTDKIGVSRYNVVWNTPSLDELGSMPTGNGAIGLNVWTDKQGDVLFYIATGDSWDENGRLLKLGKVRLHLTPAPLTTDFLQILNLPDASIKIKFGKGNNQTEVLIWVDANNPAVQVEVKSKISTTATMSFEPWRTEKTQLPTTEVSDWNIEGNFPLFVYPDVVLKNQHNSIGWYHHNEHVVCFDSIAYIQGSKGFKRQNPLLNRIFGAIIQGEKLTRIDDTHLLSPKSKKHSFQVICQTSHPSNPKQWLEDINKKSVDIAKTDLKIRWKNHSDYWKKFWNRSWIHVWQGDKVSTNEADSTFILSRGYQLQRFLSACAARGTYPIKFNGSIFTVAWEGKPGGPDYRRWGPGYWWQNTRLPYIPMLASGDFEMMKPLFNMYCQDLEPLFEYKTKKLTNAKGLYIPECVYFWGDMFPETYGWTPYYKRTDDSLQVSRWHKYEWIAQLELSYMMLDYYQYTNDKEFLLETSIPFINKSLQFFISYYKKLDSNGKIIMNPSQAAETFWYCTNPITEISGLRSVTKRLLQLPNELSSESDRKLWKDVLAKTPEIPTRIENGIKMLSPAETYDPNRSNVENVEAYPVFPFRLITKNRGDAQLAINAVNTRFNRVHFGWSYDEVTMAFLGMKEAETLLLKRAALYDEKCRFPAFWGPNFDWTPDQDHGNVLMIALQSMLLQVEPAMGDSCDNSVLILPSWNKNWNVDFKMHIPNGKSVHYNYKNSQLKKYPMKN